MTGRLRGAMLALLVAVAALSVSLLATAWVRERISDLAERTGQYERAIAKLSSKEPGRSDDPQGGSFRPPMRIEMLTAQLGRERERFYRAGELSLAEFSSHVQDSLTSFGLSVRRYRPVDSGSSQRGGRVVEFVIQGRGESLLSFIAELSRSPKYRPVPALTIRRGGRGLVDANFRIGYEELDVDDSQ